MLFLSIHIVQMKKFLIVQKIIRMWFILLQWFWIIAALMLAMKMLWRLKNIFCWILHSWPRWRGDLQGFYQCGIFVLRTRTRGMSRLCKLAVLSELKDNVVDAKIGLWVERSLRCIFDIGRGRMWMSKEIIERSGLVRAVSCNQCSAMSACSGFFSFLSGRLFIPICRQHL